MQHRTLPGTNLQVSPICLGTMTFGTPVGDAAALDLVRRACDRGVNFLDTANMYEGYSRYVGSPGGVAEAMVGKAINRPMRAATLTIPAASATGYRRWQSACD